MDIEGWWSQPKHGTTTCWRIFGGRQPARSDLRFPQAFQVLISKLISRTENKKREREGRYEEEKGRNEREWGSEGVRTKMRDAMLKRRVIKPGSFCPCGEESTMVCYTCGSVQSPRCEPCTLADHTDMPNHSLMVIGNRELGLEPFHYTYSALPQLKAPSAHNNCRESQRVFIKMALVGLHSSDYYLVEFCECQERSEQLVEMGYWPTRFNKPTFAFSIEVLSLYRALNLNASTASRAFCQTLCDPCMSSQIHVRYVQF